MAGQKPITFPKIAEINGSTRLFTQDNTGDYHLDLNQLLAFLSSEGIEVAISESSGNTIQLLDDGLFSPLAEILPHGYRIAVGNVSASDYGKLCMVEMNGSTKTASVYEQNASVSDALPLGRLIEIIGNVAIIDGSKVQEFTLNSPTLDFNQAAINATAKGIAVKGFTDGTISPIKDLVGDDIILGYLITPTNHGEKGLVQLDISLPTNKFLFTIEATDTSFEISRLDWPNPYSAPVIQIYNATGNPTILPYTLENMPDPDNILFNWGGTAIGQTIYIQLK